VRLTPEAADARRDALKKASRRKGAST